jgi:ethanolaminephosphotransferase
MFTVVPAVLLFSFYGTDFHGDVPAWWCFTEAICYFVYRLLDEMDGKQARKTGNSSPVGLMFDHGCDSFTAALICLMMSKMMQLGNGPVIMLILLAITQSFHFSTLEEYYIGGLYLGPLNGVTDGSVLIMAVFLVSGIFGTSFWASPLPGFETLRAVDLFLYAIIISQFIAVVLK